MEVKEEGEYKESEGQAKVRGRGRVAQEVGGPRQTGGRPPSSKTETTHGKNPQKSHRKALRVVLQIIAETRRTSNVK